jgi:dolichol-phosphate mannosyltransferase
VPQVLAQDARLEVLVVDDNSPDGTGQIAQALAAGDPRVHVLQREGKRGLGTAYLTGFRWALDHGYDYLFEMDADFSHDPGHLKDFLKAIQDADLVLGSRYLGGRVTVVNWPMMRLLLSYAANIYARSVIGSNGYAFQIEMSVRAWRKKFRLKEIPIVFVDRTEGDSKMNRTIVREAIWMVPRLRLMVWFGRI